MSSNHLQEHAPPLPPLPPLYTTITEGGIRIEAFLQDARESAEKYDEKQQQRTAANDNALRLVPASLTVLAHEAKSEPDKPATANESRSNPPPQYEVSDEAPSLPLSSTTTEGGTHLASLLRDAQDQAAKAEAAMENLEPVVKDKTTMNSKEEDETKSLNDCSSSGHNRCVARPDSLVSATMVTEEPLAVVLGELDEETALGDNRKDEQHPVCGKKVLWMIISLLLAIVVAVVLGVVLSKPSSDTMPSDDEPPTLAPSVTAPLPSFIDILDDTTGLENFGNFVRVTLVNETLLQTNHEDLTFFGVVSQALYELVLVYVSQEWSGHARNVVLGHVIDGVASLGQNGTALVAHSGLLLTVTSIDPLEVNGVPITANPIQAFNGVFHVANGVLYPTWFSKTITQVLYEIPEISICVELLQETGLMQDTLEPLNDLRLPQPFTVFCPTNQAFEGVGVDDTAGWRALLEYHLVRANFVEEYARLMGTTTTKLRTLEGSELSVQLYDDNATLGGAGVITGSDYFAFNGVVQVIDTVLFPL